MSRRRAALAARQLLLRMGSRTSIPIDVKGIAARLGIEIVERRLDDGLVSAVSNTSALLLRKHGRAICVVNQDHPPTRQRFSIAHEIGHFILHPPKEAYDVRARDDHSSEGVYREEIEANAFAAELLMPVEILQSKVPAPLDLFCHTDRISELARRFEVSPEAMTHRLTHLGLLSPE